jgi:hypothetical protein
MRHAPAENGKTRAQRGRPHLRDGLGGLNAMAPEKPRQRTGFSGYFEVDVGPETNLPASESA